MHDAEDDLAVAMRISRVDVAFHNVVVHQAVNDVGGFPFGRADDVSRPIKLTFVEEAVGRDSLFLSEILVRIIRIERMLGKKKYTVKYKVRLKILRS